jgi:hypothetical protein
VFPSVPSGQCTVRPWTSESVVPVDWPPVVSPRACVPPPDVAPVDWSERTDGDDRETEGMPAAEPDPPAPTEDPLVPEPPPAEPPDELPPDPPPLCAEAAPRAATSASVASDGTPIARIIDMSLSLLPAACAAARHAVGMAAFIP